MAAERLIHYHAPQTRSFAVRWLMEELGSPPHELKVLNMKKGEHKSPEYLAINPMGKVPAIVHGDTPVTELGAVTIYLADLFPEAGLAPPVGDENRGRYLRWIVFNHGAVEPAVTDRSRKVESGMSSTLSYGTYDDTVNALAGAVAQGPYVLGERFSATDVVLGSAIRWMTLFKLLPERPEFVGYLERVTSRPAFRSALAKDQALAAELAS